MIGLGQTLGNFQARLGLDAKDYARGMINAESASRVFGNTFTAFVSNPLLGSIEIFKNVGKAAIRGSQEILANAEAVERLSQQTGASEPLLIAMTKRLEIAGFTAERSRQSFQFLTKFMADLNIQGPLSTQVLDQMGISLNGLRSTDDIFRALVQGISQVEDPALRSAIAAKIFGEEAGPQLINAIGGGNAAIDEMIDQYRRLGFVIDRNANTQLAAMNTNLGFVEQAIDGVRNQLLIQFLLGVTDNAELSNEAIVKLAESMNSDLGPAVKSIGELVIPMIEGLGKIVDLANKGSDLLGSSFGAVLALLEESYILGTDGNFYAQPPTQTDATRRNRERGQQYLEEMGL